MKVTVYRDTKGTCKTGFKAMLDHAQNHRSEKEKSKVFRDQAILRFFYDLGLRRGEVVTLDADDVDLGLEQ